MRMGEFQRVLRDFSPMCICLQHVGLNPIPVRYYQVASSSPTGNGKLGTAIYVHNKITFELLELPVSNYQITAIKLNLPDNNIITICNLYNQPEFGSNFVDLPDIVNNLPHPLMLVGDFNAHNPLWNDSYVSDRSGNNLEDFILNNNFCCLNENDIPTYFSNTHGTFSTVDISICSTDVADHFEWTVADDSYSSDHFPVILNYLNNSSPPHPPRYNLNNADWDKYMLHTRNIPPFQYQQDHDVTCDFITDFIIKAADKSIPKYNPHPSKSPVPWWSETLSNLIKIKHKLSRLLNRFSKRLKILNANPFSPGNFSKVVLYSLLIDCIKPLYNKYNAKFRKAVIEGKIISWRNYISNISSKTSIKDIWHKVRKVNGSHIRSPRCPLRVGGEMIHNPCDISNILGKHLEEVSAYANLDAHFKAIRNREERVTLNFETLEHLEYNYAFTMIELENALNSCHSSAPGPDNISFEMIQKLAPLAKSYLLTFYNDLWLNNKFPKKWHHAIVIPIGKPGKDCSNPENYRPISLTSCLCKVLEKMVNGRLNYALSLKNILTPTQSGSIPGRSTLDPLTCLEDSIRRGFEQKKLTVAVFFDLTKAYDTTWRYHILRKLHIEGFRGHLPIFIQNFLSDRTFQTRIEASLSNTFKLVEGVPQGSVLSCTLFALAINDITSALPAGVQNSLYVDDFAIYYTSSSLRHAQRILNLAIANVSSWTSSVGFKFSVQKTKALIFYKDKRWLRNESIDLQLYNTPIEICNNVKFLGVVLDQHLNWKAHISYIKAKGIKALNLLKKLSHTTWGASRDTLFMIYKATVLSILDYCCPIYSSASDAALKSLNALHHEGIRLCTGAFRSSPCVSLLAEASMLPLSLRRDLITMQRGCTLQAGSSPAKYCFSLDDDFYRYRNNLSFPIRTKRLMNTHNIVPSYSPSVSLPPPWMLQRASFCTTLSYLLRRDICNPEIFRQHALEHIRRKGNKFMIYTDGSKSNLGVGAAAYSNDSVVSIALPQIASVFTAELTAIKLALDTVLENQSSSTVVFSDSRSALDAIAKYAPVNHLIQSIQLQIHELCIEGKTIELCWIPAHVGIQGNELADAAAKAACSKTISFNFAPKSDWIAALKPLIFQDWQSIWDSQPASNKLHNIKTSVQPWLSCSQKCRQAEVVLARLRIGHTRFSHGHLMSSPHGDPLACSECQIPMTVQHLLVECPNYNILRQTHFRERTMSGILAEGPDFSSAALLSYLTKTNFLKLI